jgi:hypothetical protein
MCSCFSINSKGLIERSVKLTVSNYSMNARLVSVGTGVLSPRVKPLSSADIKNGWSYTPCPPDAVMARTGRTVLFCMPFKCLRVLLCGTVGRLYAIDVL